jgi:hypothetical protein
MPSNSEKALNTVEGDTWNTGLYMYILTYICMYVYIYIYICIYIYISNYRYIHIRAYIHKYLFIHINKYLCFKVASSKDTDLVDKENNISEQEPSTTNEVNYRICM